MITFHRRRLVHTNTILQTFRLKYCSLLIATHLLFTYSHSLFSIAFLSENVLQPLFEPPSSVCNERIGKNGKRIELNRNGSLLSPSFFLLSSNRITNRFVSKSWHQFAFYFHTNTFVCTLATIIAFLLLSLS